MTSTCVFHVQMRDKEREEKICCNILETKCANLGETAATALVQHCFSETTFSNKVAQEKH